METADSQPASPPENRLFSSGDVALATFLGSVMAGSAVLGLNFLQLGRPRAATISIVGGVIGLAILLVVGIVLEDSIPRFAFTPVTLGLTFGMKMLADTLQGDALQAHKDAGGRVGRGWPAAGIGAISLVAILGVAFAAVLGFRASLDFGDSVEVDKVTVYYKDGVTEAEARKIGEHLRALGIEKEIDIQILRRDGVPHVLFIVEEGTSTDEFRDVGRSIAMDVFGGAPVVVDLADEYFEVHTSVETGPP